MDMMKTVADMVRTAEECGKDEAASRVWSEEEHRELLYRLQWYYGVLVIKSVFCFFSHTVPLSEFVLRKVCQA